MKHQHTYTHASKHPKIFSHPPLVISRLSGLLSVRQASERDSPPTIFSQSHTRECAQEKSLFSFASRSYRIKNDLSRGKKKIRFCRLITLFLSFSRTFGYLFILDENMSLRRPSFLLTSTSLSLSLRRFNHQSPNDAPKIMAKSLLAQLRDS